MKNHQLRALVAVVDHGSFRGAARVLSLSQTALTKALHELERDLGTVLLERGPQGVRPTPMGAELLPRARLILSEIDEARRSVRHLLGQEHPRVTVAATPAFSALCLSDALARFHVRYPLAQLSLRDAFLSQTLPMLREGSVDLAITALMPEILGSDLSFEPLGEIEISLAGQRGRQGPGPHGLSALMERPWLLDSAAAGISAVVRRWIAGHGVQAPARTVECTSSMASMVLSMQTDAVAPVPRAMLPLPWVASGAEEIAVDVPLPWIAVGIVLRRDRRPEPPVAWFIECARLALAASALGRSRPARLAAAPRARPKASKGRA
ncbi:MAG TPA: LysR family transcriptional regulator [Pseudorhodoferax sp.]|nr:LysR family transcriptional regulator [Pseudorhodoferax sp.]